MKFSTWCDFPVATLVSLFFFSTLSLTWKRPSSCPWGLRCYGILVSHFQSPWLRILALQLMSMNSFQVGTDPVLSLLSRPTYSAACSRLAPGLTQQSQKNIPDLLIVSPYPKTHGVRWGTWAAGSSFTGKRRKGALQAASSGDLWRIKGHGIKERSSTLKHWCRANALFSETEGGWRRFFVVQGK